MGDFVRRYRFTNMTETDDSNDATTTEVIQPVQKQSTMSRYLLIRIMYKAALIFLGYAISYMQGSLLLLFIAAGSLIWLENIDIIHKHKIKIKSEACSYSRQDLIRKIDEIPSWVKFPDRERAEWLNQVIAQLWPTLNNYIVKIFRGSIQNKIRKKHESFRFESIDFGCNPPKIDGIKVYNSAQIKDSIIVDFDVFYDGNCDINFSMSGADIGGIQDFQLSVEVRVVLKPLLHKMPLIGGIQIYFLNTPDISFTLDGLTSIPGLSSLIRTKIEEKICKRIVFPNKFTKRFSKSVEPIELKALEPSGVLRVHVFEAKDLEAKDFTGKSDPYVILSVGAQQCKTHTINQSLNPKWDYWCEFVVIDPMSQHLSFKLFDRDNVNEDDFLGSGDVDISTIIKGRTDQWFHLQNVKHGSLHLRFTWLSLSSDINFLNAISTETKLLQVDGISTAILIVYVEMATNLPEARRYVKPHPFFTLTVGDNKQKSKVKKHTVDPAWEQGFVFLVSNPKNDSLHMTITDKQTNTLLTYFTYKIDDLITQPNLEISKTEFPLANEQSKIVISLQLRILINKLFEIDDESESDSDEALSRENSLPPSSIKSRNSFESVTNKKIVESDIKKSHSQDVATQRDTITRSSSTNSNGDSRLGRIELSLNYSEPRQKLLVTVHQIANLPLKDPTDIPDPYVKIKLSNGNTNCPIYKTKVKMDCCNPVYEETFEYLFSIHEVYDLTLSAVVKTKKFFNNNTMGQVEINLKYINLSEPHRAWYDLCPNK